MKYCILLLHFFYSTVFAQQIFPELILKDNFIAKKEDVQKFINLKNNEICISLYQTGGLVYNINSMNYIFRKNGKLKVQKETIYFKHGLQHKIKNIKLTKEDQHNLWQLLNSDFMKEFSSYSQNDFESAVLNPKINNCVPIIDDAPQNGILIRQGNKQTKIEVFFPKRSERCFSDDSLNKKFIKFNELFNNELRW